MVQSEKPIIPKARKTDKPIKWGCHSFPLSPILFRSALPPSLLHRCRHRQRRWRTRRPRRGATCARLAWHISYRAPVPLSETPSANYHIDIHSFFSRNPGSARAILAEPYCFYLLCYDENGSVPYSLSLIQNMEYSLIGCNALRVVREGGDISRWIVRAGFYSDITYVAFVHLSFFGKPKAKYRFSSSSTLW